MKKPYLIAIVMSVMIIIWMGSGLLRSSNKTVVASSVEKQVQRMLVQTQTQAAQDIQLQLKVQGHVEPNRVVSIRSDIDGRVAEILVSEGQRVDAGAVLLRLDVEDKKNKLEKQRAELRARKKAYERSSTLANENFQSKSVIEDVYAALKSAEASLAQIELELKKTEIKAPFSGVIDRLQVEVGSYLSANGELARFVDNSVLVVVAPIAQQDVQKLEKGTIVEVEFAVGESRKGQLQYISTLANENTRTFRTEILVDNSDLVIPSGISASVNIPTEMVSAHFVSPAILGLDVSGQIGIKAVDENNRVVFYPVSIVQASTEGIWLNGLPKTVDIITSGQGFVEHGVSVDVVQKDSEMKLQPSGAPEEKASI